MIDQALLLVRTHATEGEINLTFTAVKANIRLRADKRMVLQILLNLLSNAIKFTLPQGKVEVSCNLNSDGQLVITVRDTGIGFEEEDIPLALSTFGQIDGALDRRHDGTGLGLPLVKSLSDLHDAKLNIQSKPNEGTIITVTFPASRVTLLD